MEGYDTLLLGQFFANQAFAKRFGSFNPAVERYEIAAKWQTGLSCSASIGQILGLQITGWASERYGYRPTMLTALIALTGFLFIQFFAANLPMLLVGYLLLGFPWGTFQTMTVSYAAEVMPIQIRPFLTTVSDLSINALESGIRLPIHSMSTYVGSLVRSLPRVSTRPSSATQPSGLTRSPSPFNGFGPSPS